MSEAKVVKVACKGPFGCFKDFEGQKDFDKYYYDISEKEVFKATGEKDPETGDPLGTVEKKFIVKKIDIQEALNAEAEMVGVEAYMKALVLQGDSIDNYATIVGDGIDDYSQLPDTLAEVLTAGDKAREVFENMDPALKGGHTTIEGFLNSLSQESVDNYIKSRIEVLTGSDKKGDE